MDERRRQFFENLVTLVPTYDEDEIKKARGRFDLIISIFI